MARASCDIERPGREDEQAALTAARLFTDYLRACRDERFAMSLLPPGRFLMPGNLAGSPALTFAPLDLPPDGVAPEGSLWAMMVRRYEAYKDVVVRPFFQRSFLEARSPDRAGRCAGGVQRRTGGAGTISRRRWREFSIASGSAAARCSAALFRPRIDRILFAATKADHLHHSSHDRLEAVLRRAVAKAVAHAEDTGAEIDVVALAAVRATREATVARGRDKLPSILGTPASGEMANGETFDGNTEVATFPGDLPDDPEQLFNGEGAFRGSLQRGGRQRPIFAFCGFGRRSLRMKGRTARRCLTSALTAPSSS